jgi:hypothetical protein
MAGYGKKAGALRALIAVAASLFSLSGCPLIGTNGADGQPGADGKAYLKIKFDYDLYSPLLTLQGLPEDWQAEPTRYPMEPGTYTGAYVLCRVEGGNAGTFDVYFNDDIETKKNGTDYAVLIDEYLADLWSQHANSLSIEITVSAGQPGEAGEPGGLFTDGANGADGADGADKIFELWLDWDPTKTTISSTDVPAPKAALGMTKEITDGRYTIRVTSRIGGGAAGLPAPTIIRAPH